MNRESSNLMCILYPITFSVCKDIALERVTHVREYSHIESVEKLTLYRIFFTELLKDGEIDFLEDEVVKYGLVLLLEERPETGDVRKRMFKFLDHRLEMIFDEAKEELIKKANY